MAVLSSHHFVFCVDLPVAIIFSILFTDIVKISNDNVHVSTVVGWLVVLGLTAL